MTALLATLSPAVASRLVEYALNSLWQLPLLAACAWLLIRLARPPVVLQHVLWIATLLLAALLPLRTQPATCGERTAAPLSPAALSTLQAPPATPERMPPAVTRGGRGLPASAASPFQAALPLRLRPVLLSARVMVRVAWLWLILLAMNVVRLTLAWLASRRLIASARTTRSTLDPEFLAVCAARLQIPTPEVLLLAGDHATPVVAGILRPVLLLPERLEFDYELAAILLHEFAHIRRRDTLANLVCRAVALPIAWHPVTPLFHARIGQTREMLCDALAARASGSSTGYARSLLTLARAIQSRSQPNLATLGMFSSRPSNRRRFGLASPLASDSLLSNPLLSHPLEERIMKLIAPASPTPAHRAARIAAGIALMAAATGASAAFHLKAVAAAATLAAPASLVQADSRIATTEGGQLSTQPAVTGSSAGDGALLPATLANRPHPDQTAPPTPPAPAAALPALAPLAALPALPALPPIAPPAAPQATPAPPAAAAPAPAPAAAPAPAPVAAPSPSVFSASPGHPITVVHGAVREMTPEERAEFDRTIAAMHLQVKTMLSDRPMDQRALSAQLKALHSPEFDRQMANVRKQLDSPEFQKQIAEAQKLAVDQAMNSGEMRKQIDEAIQQVKIAQTAIAHQNLDVHIDQARLQQELKAASAAIAHVKVDVHIDSVQLQKQLEDARKQLEDARRKMEQTAPQP